jgi:hypothetical protein
VLRLRAFPVFFAVWTYPTSYSIRNISYFREVSERWVTVPPHYHSRLRYELDDDVTCSERLWGLHTFLFNAIRNSFPGVKRLRRRTSHLPTFIKKTKKCVGQYLYAFYVFMTACLINLKGKFTFIRQRPATTTSNNLSRMQNQRLLVQFWSPDDGRCVARNILSYV